MSRSVPCASSRGGSAPLQRAIHTAIDIEATATANTTGMIKQNARSPRAAAPGVGRSPIARASPGVAAMATAAAIHAPMHEPSDASAVPRSVAFSPAGSPHSTNADAAPSGWASHTSSPASIINGHGIAARPPVSGGGSPSGGQGSARRFRTIHHPAAAAAISTAPEAHARADPSLDG